MKRVVTLVTTGALAFGLMAGPALADHDHKLTNPGGCHTIPVGHQDHGDEEPGRKFHGGAHKGPATAEDGTLGNGNSQAKVEGGAC